MRLVALSLLGTLAVACAHPSRRFPQRAIDDPVTMPAQLMELSFGATGTASDQDRQSTAGPLLLWRYGITDRLTWRDFLIFEYALLDDAPMEYAATGARAAVAPVALTVSAGLAGFGYSTIEGVIVNPMVGVNLVRHLAGRFSVGGGMWWVGGYSDSRNRSRTELRLTSAYQVLDRVVLRLSVFDWLEWRGLSPGGWYDHTLGVAFGPEFRPAHWVDLGAGLRTEAWWGRRRLPVYPITEPGPLPPPPSTQRAPILWASAWAAFRW